MSALVRASPTVKPLINPRSTASVLDHLVSDLVERWRNGERPLVEEYFDRQPSLWDEPEAALELIAEELALRAEHDQPIAEEDLVRRFPRWQAQVRVLLDCQRTLGNRLPHLRFPEPGQKIGDFDLLSELGRGAHGRVFLASQPELAGRPVVLKLSPWGGGEHLSLARLQHTHIVPLYSAHEFPEWGLIGLCLPYFGGATLAEIPTAAKQNEVGLRNSSAGDFLGRATPWEAVCWVGACLADALQYAHERGLLHLDLKPSNVLIAADGTPMLLDFHLAHAPLPAGSHAPTRLGGTVAYMAPEQKEAMHSVVSGTVLPHSVGAQADVYSLGIVLSELWERLAGGDRGSIGLADILARCTALQASDRYPTAGALAGDLRRHLMHLPLKGVSNRSLPERWRKWRRRRPATLPLALILVALTVAGIGLFRHADRQASRAQMSLSDAESRLSMGRFSEAVDACRNAEAMLDGLPFQHSLRNRVATTRLAAERAQAADDLHRLCEAVRPLHSAEAMTARQASEAASRCRELWDRREEIARKLQDQPTPQLERQWRVDLLDLGIFTANLEVRAAPISEVESARNRALETLDQAEVFLGESGVLHLERARLARELGRLALAEESDRKARQFDPQSAWEHLAIGRSRLASGDARLALASLDRSIAIDPTSPWGHYYRGVCCLRLEEPTEAIAAFTACLALNSGSAWCAYNRGLAYAQAGRPKRALTDFERSFALDPTFGLAFLGRASVHQGRGQFADALADLNRAAEAGISRSTVEYQKALVSLSAKDRPSALASLRVVLSLEPTHPEAQKLFALLKKD